MYYGPLLTKAVTISVAVSTLFVGQSRAAQSFDIKDFTQRVKPLLTKYCFECHADGASKGGMAFDRFGTDDVLVQNRELWFKVLRNVRSSLMPPAKEAQPTAEEKRALAEWIKRGAFGIDPENPDPGRVTIRRLNRVEYATTIRDLMGVDFKADEEFPPDDTGYGFDNIGDALNVSPLLLEKYMQAAETIVARAVPLTSRAATEVNIPGALFRPPSDKVDERPARFRETPRESRPLSVYDAATLTRAHRIRTAGTYHITVDLRVNGSFDFDPGRCNFTFTAGGKELFKAEYASEDGKKFHYEFDEKWEPGEYPLTFKLEPLPPVERPKSAVAEQQPRRQFGQDKPKTRVELKIVSVQVRGPVEPEKWGRPHNWERFFTKDAPTEPNERRKYAAEVLMRFASKAFHRPVNERTVERLVNIAEAGYTTPGKSFEHGIAQALVAVLASPRFLFRTEETGPSASGRPDAATIHPLVDDYALATRLSYFLWSSLPDDELASLAARGELRKNIAPQLKRMLADKRSEAFVSNFVGQWLEARDVDGISIDGRAIIARDAGNAKELEALFKQLRELRDKREAETKQQIADGKAVGERQRSPEEEKLRERLAELRKIPTVEFDGALRTAMKRETEMYFDYVLREDRSVLELLDSDYTFLNEKLAKHYGISGVFGDQMRRVTLPPNSPRGGVLTQGTVLTVTSNPTRTSPVKRGLFLLDNILGAPTRPAPPEVPALEESEKSFKGKEPTLREVLALHRSKPLCASCHNQMDPLGLAFENFNALGMWRESERKVPIDSAGTLISGEAFGSVRDLKDILRNGRREDFYRCLTEKLLTYALGRGLEYYDVNAVDRIVVNLEKQDGKISTLLTGIVESAPFQRRRAGVKE